MNERLFVVTDHERKRLEPHLPGKASDAGATATDNRLFPEAVFRRGRTGSPWPELPSAFGRRNSRFRRFRRSAKAGICESLFNATPPKRTASISETMTATPANGGI